MQITNKPKGSIIVPLLGLLLLTGCPATMPKVVTREIIKPCVSASQMPLEPVYEFSSLTQLNSPQDEAKAVVALYSDGLKAKAYSETLRYLISPCIGDIK